jgi:hypothetical protein
VGFETTKVARGQFSPATFSPHESGNSSQTHRNCREDGLEIKADKDKYVLLCGRQNARQNRDKKIPNRSFENVVWRSSYFEATETNGNLFSRK